jgi:hypothetical protein
MKVADRARLEALLNSYAHWEDFATYLIHHYMKDGGEFLIGSTAVSYLRIMMHVGNDTFGFNLGDYKSKLFYTCLEANNSTESAQWLREVTDNMMGLAFNRDLEAGKVQKDNGQTPLFVSHMKAIFLAYSKNGSAEAAMHKFSVLALRLAAGRSAEPAFVR